MSAKQIEPSKHDLSCVVGSQINKNVEGEVVQTVNSVTNRRPKGKSIDSELLPVPRTTNSGRILVQTSSNDVMKITEISFDAQAETTFLRLEAYKVEGTTGTIRRIQRLSLFFLDRGAGPNLFLKLIVQTSYYRSPLVLVIS